MNSSGGKKQNIAFNRVKKALMNKPIVKNLTRKKEIEITIDASELAVSAISSQDGHPFMYKSIKINFARS